MFVASIAIFIDLVQDKSAWVIFWLMNRVHEISGLITGNINQPS